MKVDRQTGLAWVWHIKEEKWVKRWPVDVRELVRAGEVAYQKPQDEGVPAEEAAQPPGFTPAGPPSAADTEERLGLLSKPRLQELCQENGIEWHGMDKRATLIKKLTASGVWVEDAEVQAVIPGANADEDEE